ncbi:hypothetical protein ACEUBL_05530 [Aeromonas veronii]
MKKLIFDLDDTISFTFNGDYADALPNKGLVEKLKQYKAQGFFVTISTARNMRTYEGNVGKINIYTLPTILEWLNKHDVPYDEVIVGKPWCGHEGFYVDDRAIRPSEFVNMTFDEITEMLAKEKPCS